MEKKEKTIYRMKMVGDKWWVYKNFREVIGKYKNVEDADRKMFSYGDTIRFNVLVVEH